MDHLVNAEAAYPPERGVGTSYAGVHENLMRIQATAIVDKYKSGPYQKQWKSIYQLTSSACKWIENYKYKGTPAEEGKLRLAIEITFKGLKEEISKLS